MCKKNKFTLFIFIILLSCNNKDYKENKLVNNIMFADVDLFTFKTIPLEEKDSDIYVMMKDSLDTKNITVVYKGNKNKKTYKKNLNGYYTEVVQSNSETDDAGFITIFYIVYSKNKIIYYNIHQKGKNKPMTLMGCFVIYPIDQNNIQRRLKYKINQKIINNFEDIDYKKDIESEINYEFDYEFVYEFNYKKKVANQYSVYGNKKNIIDSIDIKNSKSLASPLRNYWISMKR